MVLVSTESEEDMLCLTPLSLCLLTASASALSHRYMQHPKNTKIQHLRPCFKVSQLSRMMNCLEIQRESALRSSHLESIEWLIHLLLEIDGFLASHDELTK